MSYTEMAPLGSAALPSKELVLKNVVARSPFGRL